MAAMAPRAGRLQATDRTGPRPVRRDQADALHVRAAPEHGREIAQADPDAGGPAAVRRARRPVAGARPAVRDGPRHLRLGRDGGLRAHAALREIPREGQRDVSGRRHGVLRRAPQIRRPAGRAARGAWGRAPAADSHRLLHGRRGHGFRRDAASRRQGARRGGLRPRRDLRREEEARELLGLAKISGGYAIAPDSIESGTIAMSMELMLASEHRARAATAGTGSVATRFAAAKQSEWDHVDAATVPQIRAHASATKRALSLDAALSPPAKRARTTASSRTKRLMRELAALKATPHSAFDVYPTEETWVIGRSSSKGPTASTKAERSLCPSSSPMTTQTSRRCCASSRRSAT